MPNPTPTDAIFTWNEVLRNTLLEDDKKPRPQREQGGVTRASRAAAIVHAAIHDAINGVDRRITPYLVQDRAPAGATTEGAAAGAAHATLTGLYPSQKAAFDTKLTQYSDGIGVRFGAAVGNAVLMARQHDGRNQPDPPYQEKHDNRGTPIRHYNQNVCEIITQHPVTQLPNPPGPGGVLHVHARFFALANLAIADAGIGCWDAKFSYDLWRPIHGIRLAGQDSNPSTTAIQDWEPLGRPRGSVPHTTPPFPSYPSGHSSLGTAAFAMLRKFYGSDNLSFKLTSDEVSQARSYSTFTQAIQENGRSRIFLGVHWKFDDTGPVGPNHRGLGGRFVGQKVSDYIFPNFLRPIAP